MSIAEITDLAGMGESSTPLQLLMVAPHPPDADTERIHHQGEQFRKHSGIRTTRVEGIFQSAFRSEYTCDIPDPSRRYAQ